MMNSNITYLEAFLKRHIQDYDFELVTKPSMAGTAVMYRASIDKVAGGNLCTSGYEYNFEDAINALVAELKKVEPTIQNTKDNFQAKITAKKGIR